MSSADVRPLAQKAEALPVAAAIGVALLAVLVVHRDTFASLVSVWQQSDMFAHCFLIAPIAAFLIWRRRHDLARTPQTVSIWGLLAVAVLSAGWLVAASANVQVGQQLTVVLLIPATTVALLGVQATRVIAFPLVYLLFAVPFGEGLIPSLMDFTASFTVAALRATGIPVLREGLYFSIPSGDFEVAKACSGIRYLIACSALGTLYAYLAYRSAAKRALFIAVSVIAPIVANGVRAYLIVMIAHLSEMKLATGVDHLVYGWLFFGLLVALLFWVGGRFADPVGDGADSRVEPRAATHGSRTTLAGAAALVIGMATVAPYLQAASLERTAEAWPPARLPVLTAPWSGPRYFTSDWRLAAPAGVRETAGTYVGQRVDAEVAVLRFGRQSQDAEMVGSVTQLIAASSAQILETGRGDARLDGDRAVAEIVLRVDRDYRIVWYWYRIGGTLATEDWYAKVLEAWNALQHGQVDATLVVASAQAPDAAVARGLLRDFLAEAWPEIERCLDTAAVGCAEAPR